MSAGKYNIVIEQGATYEVELQYKDSNGVVVDLTGYSGRMQIRPSIGSPTSYLCLSSSLQADGTGLNFSGSNGSTPPTSGSIGIYISAATSSMLTFNTGVYDLEIQSGSFVTRLLQGNVQLSKEVTTGVC
jgi:hypothetical protein